MLDLWSRLKKLPIEHITNNKGKGFMNWHFKQNLYQPHTYFEIYFLDQCVRGKFKPSGWLGKKIPNLARGWLRWWWSGQDFHSNVINFGSGLEHSFAFLILNVPIWPKPGKWFPHEILPLIGEMVRGNMYHREGN